MQKIKTVAYCRVSTDAEEQANSFVNQKEHFTKYISESEDMTFVDIYADRGITGTSLDKRPEFNRMIEDAGLDISAVRNIKGKIQEYVLVDNGREPLFTLILVSNTSRFARNVEVVSILRRLKKKGVYVTFTDINKTTAKGEDEAFIQFFLAFDEMESRDKSEKTRQGHLRSAKRGRMHANGRIYGYSYDATTKTLSIIEREAEIIRFIFDQYAKGYGLRRIADMLDEMGYKARTGKRFAKSSINKILTNEKYKGTLVRNKWTRGRILDNPHSPKVRPEEEWFVFEDDDRIPAIVDADLWDKCQEVRAGKVSTQNQLGVNRGTSEYAGKIFCSKCGATYTRNVDRGRVFFNCGTKKTRGTKVCDGKNVSLVFINEQEDLLVTSWTRNVKEITGAYRAQLESVKRVLFSRLDESRANEIAELQQRRQELEERLEQLLALMTNAAISISAERIAGSIAELERQLVEADEKIYELSKDNTSILADIQEIENLQDKLLRQREQKLSRQEILNQVEKMTVVYVEEADELRIDFALKLEQRIKDMTSKYIGGEAHKEAVSSILGNVL